MKKNNLHQKERASGIQTANLQAMTSVKVFAVKSMSITDYVIQMKSGKNVYVFDGIEQLSASGVEKNARARSDNWYQFLLLNQNIRKRLISTRSDWQK